MIADLRATRAHGDVTVVEGVNPGDLEMSLRAMTAGTMPMEKEILVLAVSSSASPGSGVVVMGRGTPDQLLGNRGPAPGLSSETTGRRGLVSNVDLVATVLAYLGHPDPDAPGNPIYTDGFEPAELQDLYAEYRKVVVPVGLFVLGFALAALAVGLAILLGAWRPAPGVGRAVAVVGLFAVSLNVAMLPGSWLPRLLVAGAPRDAAGRGGGGPRAGPVGGPTFGPHRSRHGGRCRGPPWWWSTPRSAGARS